MEGIHVLTAGCTTVSHEPVPMTLYWRPGCAYSTRLRHGLGRAGVSIVEVNIYEDRVAALYVRSVAGGNETVPTVTIGATSMVNPSVRQVLNEIRRQCPELQPPPGLKLSGRVSRWLSNRE